MMLKLKCPKSTDNISVNAYAKILRVIKDNKDIDSMTIGFIKIFNDLTDDDINRLTRTQILEYYNKMINILDKSEPREVREIINIDGVLYGLEPDISNMERGAWVAIQELSPFIDKDDNLAAVMAILYRPINGKIIRKRFYEINSFVDEKQHKFEARKELFGKSLTLTEVQSCLNFILINQKQY